MQDKLLEVVGIHGSFQLGAAQVGLYRPTRLAQASRIRIKNKETLPVQVDGEPWYFGGNGEIEITWQSQALLLARRAHDAHAVATDVIDWALGTKVISMEQRNTLMMEISRRAQKVKVGVGNTM